MDTRRAVLKKMLVGATALPLGAAATAQALVPAGKMTSDGPINMAWLEETLAQNPEAKAWLAKLAEMPSGPAPWDLIAPLQAGSEVGLGWTLDDLSAVELGGVVLTLSHKRGHIAHVHVCRREGQAKGLTHSTYFDVFVMNGGDGERPSDEDLGRAVLGIGQLIRTNESKVDSLAGVAKKLLSHDERVELFGPESLLA